MGIFDKRVSYKPFEYPEMDGFVDAINHSIWFFTEYNYDADIHDFCVNFSEAECNAIKNAMLAISQIEVSVKEFWSKLSDKLPKPEIQQVGATFAESEVRHARAYSHLLNLLGLNDDFQLILNNPVIQGRVDYLSK